ncbi:MAG TPA: GNAT family N-acetyltransferase [Chloroflexota bacterium]|nr:GNAT family N-acetyltransferase [Chloroflexota bacterium]
MSNDRFRFEVLSKDHNRTEFSCGVDELDRYFQQQAGQDQRRNLAVPHVLVDTRENRIAGYYTLSSLSVLPGSVPSDASRRLARYSTVPTILLGRLAVDRSYRGQGLGKLLLMDALRRSLEISNQQVGAWAVVVDAKDDQARSFYEHYGFIRFLDDAYRLFLPMATVSRLGF